MTKQEYMKTAQEKERQAFDRIDEMAKSFQENPESIAEFLEFGTKFYHYSPRNTALIRKQNPGATYVDSYVGWKEKNAHVLKGSKALQILVPVNVTYLKTDNGWIQLSRASDETKRLYHDGKIESRTKLCYKIGNVFDISQTDFPKEEYPKLFHMGYPSVFHEDISRGLKDFSEQALNCKVFIKDLSSIALRGRYLHTEPPVIELNEKLESTQKLSTLSHELGHALIHAKDSKKSTFQKEFEADAFSIMLCTEFGIELTESRKKHLADHYRNFREIIIMEHPGGKDVEKILQEELFKSFSNVFEIYRNNIDEIQKCVEVYVPREQLKKEDEQKMEEQRMELESDIPQQESMETEMII